MICVKCKTEAGDNFTPCRRNSVYPSGWICRVCIAEYARKYRASSEVYARHTANRRRNRIAKRIAVLTHYSNGIPKCACCGETEVKFLAIDHMNGNGSSHRKTVPVAALPRWLQANNYPSGFQVLCHNCNCAKGYYGMCPHQEKSRECCTSN